MENEVKICKECGRTLPIDRFKATRWGTRANICTDCSTKKLRQTMREKQEQEHTTGLQAYTPRELMSELARRGYEGTLRYTKVEEIDITNF